MSERFILWQITALRWVRELRDREDGQAAVEYGVLIALILAVAIAFIPGIGTKVADAFSKVSSSLP
jgi:Flp pilus assembly pilin Flp